MSVRKFSNDPSLRSHLRAPIGIKKTAPTNGSKTQRRKNNKANHMRSTAQFK